MRGKQLWVGVAIGVVAVLLLGAALTASGLIQPAVLAQARTATPQPTQSQPENPAALPRTITVVGEGSVRIQPDIARAHLGVETMAPTVREATNSATATMEAILTALKAQGIAERDVQTSGFSIWADRGMGLEGRIGEQVVYRVSNNVQITIRNLDNLGAVLDAAIEAGANAVHGVSFAVDEPKPLLSEAREQAIADALFKATEWASLTNVQVGPVVSISEVVGAPGVMPLLRGAEAVGMGGGVGPFSPGELELTVQVQVVYELR